MEKQNSTKRNEWVNRYNDLSKKLYKDVPKLSKEDVLSRYDELTDHYMNQPIEDGTMSLINDFGVRNRIKEYFGEDWSDGRKNGRKIYKINIGNVDNVDDFLSKIKKMLTKNNTNI